MQADLVNLERRKFLSAVRVAGLIGAAAALTGAPVEIEAAELAPESLDPVEKRGYHETEHIRKYYAAARYF
jgi:hypothetical protein